MTRDEAVSMIKLQLGFRSNQDANIISCLKLAQTQLELQPTKPWFLISEDSYAFTSSGEQRIAIPTDFLQEVDEAVLRYVPEDSTDPSEEVDLWKDDYDALRKNYANWTNSVTGLSTGAPEAYCLLDGYFRIFPTPDATYRLRMIYYAQDDVLSTNIENQWLKYAPLLLMGKAGRMISEGPLRDKEATGVFLGWEQQASLSLAGQVVARDMSNRRLQMGGSHQ